jgi:hypothetical protein
MCVTPTGVRYNKNYDKRTREKNYTYTMTRLYSSQLTVITFFSFVDNIAIHAYIIMTVIKNILVARVAYAEKKQRTPQKFVENTSRRVKVAVQILFFSQSVVVNDDIRTVKVRNKIHDDDQHNDVTTRYVCASQHDVYTLYSGTMYEGDFDRLEQ